MNRLHSGSATAGLPRPSGGRSQEQLVTASLNRGTQPTRFYGAHEGRCSPADDNVTRARGTQPRASSGSDGSVFPNRGSAAALQSVITMNNKNRLHSYS